LKAFDCAVETLLNEEKLIKVDQNAGTMRLNRPGGGGDAINNV
jgi:hypothetical protein